MSDGPDWFDNTVVLLLGLVGIFVTGSFVPLLTFTLSLMAFRMIVPKL